MPCQKPNCPSSGIQMWSSRVLLQDWHRLQWDQSQAQKKTCMWCISKRHLGRRDGWGVNGRWGSWVGNKFGRKTEQWAKLCLKRLFLHGTPCMFYPLPGSLSFLPQQFEEAPSVQPVTDCLLHLGHRLRRKRWHYLSHPVTLLNHPCIRARSCLVRPVQGSLRGAGAGVLPLRARGSTVPRPGACC